MAQDSFWSWLWDTFLQRYDTPADGMQPDEVDLPPPEPGGGAAIDTAPGYESEPPSGFSLITAGLGGDKDEERQAKPAGRIAGRTQAPRYTLTLKANPRLVVKYLDPEIKEFLSQLGLGFDSIEWQKPVALNKYSLPKYDEDQDARDFDFTLYKVIPGQTGGSDPVDFFEKYVDFDAPYPAYDLMLEVAERDNYPIVATGKVSKDKPFVIDLPGGWYVLAPTVDKRRTIWKPWWVVWGDPGDAKVSTWEAFRDFWGGETITSIHRFRGLTSYDRGEWVRLLHLDRNEGYTWRPRYIWKWQDWEKVPPSWDEKIAQWAEQKAEAMWETFKGIFGQ